MARKPLRPCRHPGCPVLTRDGWCDQHKPAPKRRASAEYHGWYFLPIWGKQLRPQQLLREPFCRECAKNGIRTRATVVDHIRPHRGDWELFCDPTNHQSLCEHHHSQKTLKEQREKQQDPVQK